MSILDRSESRDGYTVRVLAVHTSEGFDKPVVDDAAALRDASWWVGSSHAIADNDPGSLLTPAQGCVPYERASWTLRSGNRWSENIELVAQAGWTRAEWLARPKLLDRCAFWLAERSEARSIPLVKLTPEQYRAGGWGVIGHHDHTIGYSDGSHWDPGPNFPWDVVLAQANAYRNGTAGGFLMALTDAQQSELHLAVLQIRDVLGARGGFNTKTENSVAFIVRSIPGLLAALQQNGVDENALVQAMRPLLFEAVQAAKSADAAATADEIVDELVERLGKPADLA